MPTVVQVAAAKASQAKVAAAQAAANPKGADPADVTASIAKPAKDADKPWMFANFFGAKAADGASDSAPASSAH
jgi:hypothetical protein